METKKLNTREDLVKLFKPMAEKANNVAITAHVRSDGDAIGSCVAMYYYFKLLGKKAKIFLDSEIPAEMKFLFKEGMLYTSSDFPSEKFDLVLTLDTAKKDMLGKYEKLLEQTKLSFAIDHHASHSAYTTVEFVKEAVSNTALIFGYFRDIKLFESSVKEEYARILEAILVGIITDSGGLAYNNVDNGAAFLEAGLVVTQLTKIKTPHLTYSKLYNILFNKKTKKEKMLTGYILNNMLYFSNDQVVIVFLTDADSKRFGVKITASELAVLGQDLLSAKVVIGMSEEPDIKKIKVSLRANNSDLDVNKIAGVFGGGGHKSAAGCILDCSIYEAIHLIASECEKALTFSPK